MKIKCILDEDEDSPLAPWQGEETIVLILAPQLSPYDIAGRLPYPPHGPKPVVFGLDRAINIFANNNTVH
jgi:hypothetical protein